MVRNGYAERLLGDDAGKDCVFGSLVDATLLPFRCEFFPYHDRAHPLLDPVIRPALSLVDRDRAFNRNGRVLVLLDAFVSDLRKPSLERFRTRARNRLN